MLWVTRPLARAAHVAALAAVGLGALAALAALRDGAHPRGWGLAAVALLVAATLLAPAALILAASGWGTLPGRGLLLSAALCALGGAVALVAAFAPGLSLWARGLAALVAGADGWGVWTAARLARQARS